MTYPLDLLAAEALSFIDMALHIDVFIIASLKKGSTCANEASVVVDGARSGRGIGQCMELSRGDVYSRSLTSRAVR